MTMSEVDVNVNAATSDDNDSITQVERKKAQCTTVMFGNVAGLVTRCDKTKLKILHEEATTENAIVIALTESHLTEYHLDSEINLDGYICYRTDRATGRKKEV